MKQLKINRKGQGITINFLAVAAVLFVIAAVVLSVGADVLTDIQEDYTDTYNKSAWNTSGQGIESLNELGGWLSTIALVVAAVIIIGLLFGFFGRYARG